MSTTTTRLALVKPALTDAADVTATNANWDALDKSVLQVAQATSVHVTTTTQQTIVSATPPANGLYEVSAYVNLSNSVSGNKIALTVQYTDPQLGAVGLWFSLVTGVSTAGPADGSTTIFANGPLASSAILISATTAAPIAIKYTDPTNTPNDYVSAAIKRVN